MAVIQRQCQRSLRDPELRQLAVKIVSGSYEYSKHPRSGRSVPTIRAFGKDFLAPDANDFCPANDAECEIRLLWDFVTKNVRYVYDPDNVDFFATAKYTLLAGGGDCDDYTILFGGLGGSIGFKRVGRVVAIDDAPSEWAHVYPMLGVCSKANPTHWVPLDATIEGSYPGWQYEGIVAHRDYPL